MPSLIVAVQFQNCPLLVLPAPSFVLLMFLHTLPLNQSYFLTETLSLSMSAMLVTLHVKLSALSGATGLISIFAVGLMLGYLLLPVNVSFEPDASVKLSDTFARTNPVPVQLYVT